MDSLRMDLPNHGIVLPLGNVTACAELQQFNIVHKWNTFSLWIGPVDELAFDMMPFPWISWYKLHRRRVVAEKRLRRKNAFLVVFFCCHSCWLNDGSLEEGHFSSIIVCVVLMHWCDCFYMLLTSKKMSCTRTTLKLVPTQTLKQLIIMPVKENSQSAWTTIDHYLREWMLALGSDGSSVCKGVFHHWKIDGCNEA